MTRAVTAGVPILLGPRIYTINNFSTGTLTNFILKGVQGASVIQRTSAAGSQFFQISAANVVIDGVVFDMNKANVTANQWGVFLGSGGQTVSITHSVFKNNSGSLGSCFDLVNTLGTGAAGGGSFAFTENEVTGCTWNAAYFGSVTNGIIARNYVHDNTTMGVFIGTYLAASATNYLSDVLVDSNRVFRNTTGIAVGGYSPPYSLANPPAVRVQVTGNNLQDNSGYQISLEGAYLNAIGNTINQSATLPTSFGGIDAFTSYSVITDNQITLSGSSYGIDCGGSVQMLVSNNNVTVNMGSALNVGGNQNSRYTNNLLTLSGTATGVLIYEIEADGNNNAFPTVSSGIEITDNTFNMASTAGGIRLIDSPGGRPGFNPTIIKRNAFNGGSTSNDVNWIGSGSSLIIDDNRVNGGNTSYVVQIGGGNCDVVYDLVFTGGYVVANTIVCPGIREVVPAVVESYGSGSGILYVYPTSGGSGYVQATTTLTATGSGGGSGWTGTAEINNGVIVGVRTSTYGTGYSGTLTVTATDSGGGSGAVFVVGNRAVVPQYTQVTVSASSPVYLQTSGGYISMASTPILFLGSGSNVTLRSTSGGGYWSVIDYLPPYVAVGSLVTCNSNTNGGLVTVTGSVTGKWQARCNGTNWLWPDGSTVSN